VARIEYAAPFTMEEMTAGMIETTGLDKDTVIAWMNAVWGPDSVSDDVILAAISVARYRLGRSRPQFGAWTFKGEAFEGGSITLLDAAVATVLLKSIREELPQWAVVDKGAVTLGRSKNRQSVRSAYKPKHLFTLNWADSGPTGGACRI
jgi:hypothetical protein